MTLTMKTPDLSYEKKESLKEIVKSRVTAYMNYHRPPTLLDLDTSFGHMRKSYGTALVSGQVEDTRRSEVSSDVVKVKVFLSVADYFV